MSSVIAKAGIGQGGRIDKGGEGITGIGGIIASRGTMVIAIKDLKEEEIKEIGGMIVGAREAATATTLTYRKTMIASPGNNPAGTVGAATEASTRRTVLLITNHQSPIFVCAYSY